MLHGVWSVRIRMFKGNDYSGGRIQCIYEFFRFLNMHVVSMYGGKTLAKEFYVNVVGFVKSEFTNFIFSF